MPLKSEAISSRLTRTASYVINPAIPWFEGKGWPNRPFHTYLTYLHPRGGWKGDGRRFTPVTVEHFSIEGVFFASIHPVRLFSASFQKKYEKFAVGDDTEDQKGDSRARVFRTSNPPPRFRCWRMFGISEGSCEFVLLRRLYGWLGGWIREVVLISVWSFSLLLVLLVRHMCTCIFCWQFANLLFIRGGLRWYENEFLDKTWNKREFSILCVCLL